MFSNGSREKDIFAGDHSVRSCTCDQTVFVFGKFAANGGQVYESSDQDPVSAFAKIEGVGSVGSAQYQIFVSHGVGGVLPW